MVKEKTVAALSTPHGKGGIAVIRITGDETLEIASRCFKPACGRELSSVSGGRAVYGRIVEGDETIDDGIAAVFRAPKSFTGEDTVEISCHGGILNAKRVLEAVFAAGAEPAEAGEFTKRAFLSGRMTLTEAEAVADLIDADTESKRKLSRQAIDGRISSEIEAIYNGLVELSASVFAVIDYPEEDLSDLSNDEIAERLAAFSRKLSALISSYRTGKAISDGVETTVCGRPNVGKSAIYNRILGEDRAIVTDIAGTTRDLLRDRAEIGGVTLNLCDTAGIRESDDTVENVGIERAKDRAEKSELILAVFDSSSEFSEEDGKIIEMAKNSGGTVIALLNKCDLPAFDMSKVTDVFPDAVRVSAVTGEGFDSLAEKIGSLYNSGDIEVGSPIVYSARQYAALKRGNEALCRAYGAITSGFSADAVSVDIEEAMAALGECDGRAVGEDIVRTIFSRFCVGK